MIPLGRVLVCVEAVCKPLWNELQGEKVDIVLWSDDLGTFIVSALAPAEIAKVIIDEDEGKVDVVVPEDQLSLAIGRRGQNVRLASGLSKMDISIVTEADEEKNRAETFKARAETFISALDVDDVIGHLLAAEGFTSLKRWLKRILKSSQHRRL